MACLPISENKTIYTHNEKSSSKDQTVLVEPPRHESCTNFSQPSIPKSNRVSARNWGSFTLHKVVGFR